MANRFTARMRSVLKERGESMARLHEAQADQAERNADLDALVCSAEQEVAGIFAEFDAKDPCWRCRNVSRGLQPYCMVDQAFVPAGGCKRGQRCAHAG